MPHQIGDPFGVLHIGVAARHVLEALRGADDDREIVLQQRMHRAPIDAGALPSDRAAPGILQPVAQHQQPGCRGGKTADLFAPLSTRLANQQAGDDHRLVHLQPATPFDQSTHRQLRATVTIAAPRRGKRHSRTRSAVSGGKQMVIPISSADQSLPRGHQATKGGSASNDHFLVAFGWPARPPQAGQILSQRGARAAGWLSLPHCGRGL